MEGADESKKVVQMLFSTGEESRFGLRTRSADEIIELQNDALHIIF